MDSSKQVRFRALKADERWDCVEGISENAKKAIIEELEKAGVKDTDTVVIRWKYTGGRSHVIQAVLNGKILFNMSDMETTDSLCTAHPAHCFGDDLCPDWAMSIKI